MSKKLGFALGAGGSRGVAHVGFLQAMEENGIVPDYIAGVSMGSVVGSCYALGMKPDEMMKEIERLKFADIFDLSINPLGNAALLRAKKMRRKLHSYLKHNKFSQSKIPFKCVATDLVTGTARLFEGEEEMIDGVVASSSIPGVFKPVEYKGCVLVDGALVCRVPIKEVKEMGADVVVAVDVLGAVRKENKRFNMLTVMTRTFDVMDAELTRYKKNAYAPDLFLEPELGDMSQYRFKDLKNAYQKGYELGVANVSAIKALLQE